MNILSISGKNKQVHACMKALCKVFKGKTVLEVGCKLNHEPDLKALYEEAYMVKIHC